MQRILVVFLCLTFGIRTNAYTIVIDPGHGGRYVGAINQSPKVVEKEIALILSHALADKLRAKGHTVILTRETDVALDDTDHIKDLYKRAEKTTKHKADLFISLHLNSTADTRVSGYEVYVPYEAQFPMKSYMLASAIHYDISHDIPPQFGGGNLGNLNSLDKGIRASKFNVLVKATCPAVLIELAYLTHPATAEKLLQKEYQELLVTAIYKGILRYFAQMSK